MKRIRILVCLILVFIIGVFSISALAATNGHKTCRASGEDAYYRIIYREIYDTGENHYAVFAYDEDCIKCGYTYLTEDYAKFFPHSGTPCGLCGHTGNNCTGCN